jgi:crotonobetainyl-CoA:carnitine CoA-transferase CaiB-like acyl-CoA transferase
MKRRVGFSMTLQMALAGLRILDLSRILAGPWCTQNLADLGADVIKVESLDGDDTRGWGPPFLKSDDARLSAYFSACNRNKRSIGIDFSTPQGADLVRALAVRADVVVENFKSGSLAKYGLDYASLRSINPRIVYLSITGFGQDGPQARRPGYDYIFQGMTGLMSYTGLPDGQPGAGPLRAGVAVVDLMTGMSATVSILAALRDRDRTGEGQHIDLALLDVGVAMNANQGANYLVSGRPPQRTGNTHPNLSPYEVFACRDGHIILAVGNDSQFQRLCELIKRRDLAVDERFRLNAGRLGHAEALRDELTSSLRRWARDDLGASLERIGIPWGPIRDLAEVFSDEQVQHRNMAGTITHPTLGPVPTVRNPCLPRGTNLSEMRAPPLLGEHTDEILSEIGLSADQIAVLRRGAVLA